MCKPQRKHLLPPPCRCAASRHSTTERQRAQLTPPGAAAKQQCMCASNAHQRTLDNTAGAAARTHTHIAQ
jgi:hypothetical protein